MNIFKQVTLADSLSVLNALLGFSAISYVLINGLDKNAFTFFYLAVLADGADGLVASKTEKSPFGKELDSLADTISFGAFPAVILVKYEPNLFPFASLILAFSILRLARFNVLKFEHFYGLPTIVSALIISSLIRISVLAEIIAISSLILSIFMVSDVVYPRIRNPLVLFPVALIIISAMFLDEMVYAILLISTIYLIYSPIREVLKWKEGKKLHLKQE